MLPAEGDSNKGIIQRVFQELSQGNSRPLLDLLADDVTWKVMGRTPWSRTYTGKQDVVQELLRQLGTRLSGRYRATAERIIAEGPYVVVQATGSATTTSGAPYNNEYCFIYKLDRGAITEVTEYLDTELVSSALGQTGVASV